MAIVKTATPKKRAKKRGLTSRKLKGDGYRLKDGRAVQMVPWIAQTPQPWRNGYARVFIPFTALELRNARNGKRGHEQIVHSSKLVRG